MIAAVVPAAGHSRRMGRPKLTLRVGGSTVIARVVAALRGGGVSTVVVVPPPADAPGAAALALEAEWAGAAVVVPAARPPDMRASFEIALDYLEALPEPVETLLLIPADSPGVSARLVTLVAAVAEASAGSGVVPVSGGRRGHPIAMPWELALRARELPVGVGINALVATQAGRVVELPVDDPGAVDDLDTPDDYRRWLARVGDPGHAG